MKEWIPAKPAHFDCLINWWSRIAHAIDWRSYSVNFSAAMKELIRTPNDLAAGGECGQCPCSVRSLALFLGRRRFEVGQMRWCFLRYIGKESYRLLRCRLSGI